MRREDNYFKLSKTGLETVLKRKLSFWELFAILALILLCVTAIIITLIIVMKAYLISLSGIPIIKKIRDFASRVTKSRSP